MERSEGDVVTGVLRISVGGTAKAVPTLKLAQVSEWTLLVDAYTPSQSERPAVEGLTIAAEMSMTTALDLVLAYDRTAALGGRDWLREHADPAELRVALDQMLGNVYPKDLASMALAALNLTVHAAVGRSALLSTPNGSSTPGASRPNRSARRSTRSK